MLLEAPGSPPLISPTADSLHEHPNAREVDKHDLHENLEMVRKTGQEIGTKRIHNSHL
jgi:hypothetical protein